MSFIGTLEKFSLATVLLKIEEEAKNGVLIIKQEAQWVELSFRRGQLICIGPVRSHKTLGDRLLQAGVISQKALQEVSTTLDTSIHNETRTVIALIDLGYLNQDSLYTWVAREATKVLQVLLSWSSGEIYFDESLQPPSNRLLIALTVSSLVHLPTFVPASRPASITTSAMHIAEQTKLKTYTSHIPDALTLHEPSQFFSTSATLSSSNSLDFNDGHVISAGRNTDVLFSPNVPVPAPKRLNEPLTPTRINTTFMQPQMVLYPTDLSKLRDSNLHVRLTPEQWRLFTVADGNTTLQTACQQLVMSPEQVCQVAGELVALGLVTVSFPVSGSMHDSQPFPMDFASADSNISYVSQAQNSGQPLSSLPIETYSQWGNGGTGATFVLGNGWVVTSSPSQPLQSSEQYNGDRIEYAEASVMR